MVALGFYALSDILLWQRIFEANGLWMFDADYQTGHVAILLGMLGLGRPAAGRFRILGAVVRRRSVHDGVRRGRRRPVLLARRKIDTSHRALARSLAVDLRAAR